MHSYNKKKKNPEKLCFLSLSVCWQLTKFVQRRRFIWYQLVFVQWVKSKMVTKDVIFYMKNIPRHSRLLLQVGGSTLTRAGRQRIKDLAKWLCFSFLFVLSFRSYSGHVHFDYFKKIADKAEWSHDLCKYTHNFQPLWL